MLITSFRISEQLTSSAFDDNNLMGRAKFCKGAGCACLGGGGQPGLISLPRLARGAFPTKFGGAGQAAVLEFCAAGGLGAEFGEGGGQAGGV